MFVTGWTVLLAALGAVPAALTQQRNVAWLWVLGVAVLVALDVWMAPSPQRIGAKRRVPASVRLTESTSAKLDVINVSPRRRVRGAIRDAWQPSAGASDTRHQFALAPGESLALTTHLTPTRRGDRKSVGVTIRTSGPMRLAGRQRTIPLVDTLRVLPEFKSRRHLPSRLARLREIDGRTAVQLKGAGSEFDSLREYVIGDDVRTIDWRATARRADVVVKTYRPERDRRVFIVLDTSRLSAGRVGDTPRLDASIEATLLLSALASRAGDRVQVSAFDREEQARAAATTGAALMTRLATALAPVESRLLEPDWPAVARLTRERLSQRALVVLLTTVEVSAIDSGLLEATAALSHRHQVVIASVADPEVEELLDARGSVDALYGAAAAARTGIEVDAVGSRLRSLGADVISALPDDLAPVLADRYLALKAAGKL
jgi:uncharacterized protein (DUF58 family)